MDRKPAAVTTNGKVEAENHAASSGQETSSNAGEIPFLVTHWLANYVREQQKGVPDSERQAVLKKISKATGEIASAFFALGAYGTTFQVSLP